MNETNQQSSGLQIRIPDCQALEPVPGVYGQRVDEPVVVLTCSRSGSTLLRLILDTHPALACPAETGIIKLSTFLVVQSTILRDWPAGVRPRVNNVDAELIRYWIEQTYGAYLTRTGKSRWCDKSLGSAAAADRWLYLFPKTRFICLYRHCMDLIDSILEACPWGLHDYGLEKYMTVTPGRPVATTADYWVGETEAIASFEARHPDICLRLRYEDLTANPEEAAERVFTFLGEDPSPGITSRCFGKKPVHGHGDHKVWGTSAVHAASVGRGRRVPVAAIPSPTLRSVNDLLRRLGYETIDENWNKERVAEDSGAPAQPTDSPAGPDSNQESEPGLAIVH